MRKRLVRPSRQEDFWFGLVWSGLGWLLGLVWALEDSEE